jgi:SAM domain (Sterile alpha motif)
VDATVDVAAWLKNLGLGQYEAAFRDNAIDGDLLPSLTAEDHGKIALPSARACVNSAKHHFQASQSGV